MIKGWIDLNQRFLWRAAAAGLILISFFLRVYQLNHIAVDKGELMSITWFIRKGFVYLLTHNKDLNNHPLNSVLARLTSGSNESVFTLRWHSVVIGVLTVAIVLLLARKWFGRRDSLVAALLLATSAYHVSFSQIARGYVGLIGFTLFGFYFVLRAIETGRKRYWLAFSAISALNIYNHLYGAMAVGILGMLAAGLLLRRAAPRPWPALKPLVASLLVVYLAGFGLYLPMRADTLAIVGQANQFRDSDLRQAGAATGLEKLAGPVVETIRPFSLVEDATRLRLADPGYAYTALDPLAILAENRFGFYLSLLTFLLGLLFSWRKFGRPTLLLVVWLAIPFTVQAVGSLFLPGSYFRGRFLAFIYPPFLLLSARGWPGLADWLAGRVGRAPRLRALAAAPGWAGLALLVLLNLAWLSAYYTAAATERWQEVADRIVALAGEQDVVFCAQRPKLACDADLSTRTGRDVPEMTSLVTVDNVQANRAFIEQPGRAWLVLPRMPGPQVERLLQQVAPDHFWLAGPPGSDRAGLVLVDSGASLGDNLAAGLQLAAGLALNDEEKLRAYTSLLQLHLGREQLAAAEEAFGQASALLPPGTGLGPVLIARLEYARQAARPAAGLPPTAVPVDLNMAGLARLLAYEIDRPEVSPGESVRVTLYWQPLTLIEQELVSYVHLTGPNATPVGRSTGIPGAGELPTTAWEPGQLVVDTHTVAVEAGAPAPLALTIQAGLFDPAGQQFIQAIDTNARPVAAVLGRMKVVPPAWSTPEPAYPLDASFDGLIGLKGYDLLADPPGVVLYWQALAPMAEDYTVFIHLLDTTGQVVAQIDGPPLAGSYPTSWWSPGEVLVDARPAPAVAPGRYRLVAGWYRLADGSRLPLAGSSGDSVDLGEIEFPGEVR